MDEPRYREAEHRLREAFGVPSPEEVRVPLSTAGVDVRVQRWDEGPPVLFVHGGPNAGSTWVPIVPYFGDFTAFVVDRPGTGVSGDDVLAERELGEDALRFVGELVDWLGVDRAHVAASSLGSMHSLRSAGADPSRYGRIVQWVAPPSSPACGRLAHARTGAVAERTVGLLPYARLEEVAASGRLCRIDEPEGTGRRAAEYLRAT